LHENLFDKLRLSIIIMAFDWFNQSETKLKMRNTIVKQLMSASVIGWTAMEARCSHYPGIAGMKR
jgi:hypothetical protein